MKLGRVKKNKQIAMISTKALLQYQGLDKDIAKIKKELARRGHIQN